MFVNIINHVTQKAILQDEGTLGVHTLQSHQMEDLVNCVMRPDNTDKPVQNTESFNIKQYKASLTVLAMKCEI